MGTTSAGTAAQAGVPSGTTVKLTEADFFTALLRTGNAASTIASEAAAAHKVVGARRQKQHLPSRRGLRPQESQEATRS